VRAAFILAALFLGAGVAAPARGDWEVKRRGGEALLAQALRTLQAVPDQPGLAARISRMASRAELASALQSLARAAERAPPRYEPREAYAQLLLAAGRHEEAAESFAQAMALRPEAAAPAVGRARALVAAGKLSDALAAYEEALRRERSPAAKAALLRALAALANRAGAVDREIAAREALAALLPSNGPAALELAEALRRGGKPAAGAEVIERMAGARPAGARRAELLERAAALREEAGDDAAAERLLRECLAAAPAPGSRAALYGRLAEIARRRDSLPALAASLEKQVAAAGPGRAVEWAALARVREDLGDFAGALEAARRAAALDPGDLPLRRRILSLLERLGREAELMAAFDELERRWPGDPSFAIERIDRKFRLGDRDEARALFDRALRTLRRNGEALASLADLASRWSEDDRVLAAWDAVLARAPRDERAIVGLGEAHFQRGRRELARRTWRGLLKAVRPRAAAHARLAELLGDHELVDEAVVEARAAQKLEPQNPHHRRTLARILERKKDFAGAMVEWRAVLAASQGPGRAAERREARSSLINLLTREGRGRLDLESVRLAEQMARQPDDRETILFLAEVELRRMDPERALATLREAAARRPDDAEIVGALVRLLRQSRHYGEAIGWLEKLAAQAPDRARDAYVQVAEMELQRYSDARALAFARRAEELAGDDPDALARIGEIEERAGQADRALATYRRALERGPSAKAATALHRLLVRRGAAEEAAQVLRSFVRATSDDEARAELLRGELDVEEYLGTLPAFERLLVSLPGNTTAARKVAVALLQRLVPRLYAQAATDTAASAELERASRWGVRPLVELVTEPEVEPDPALVELLGMLGNRNATPVLVRLLTAEGPRTSAPPKTRGPGARISSSTAQVAAAIALGRLGDGRAASALAALAGAPDAGVRAVALWALGRTRGPGVPAALHTATNDPRTDVAAVACLGLGRLRDPRASRTLVALATDLSRPARVRRAAALGLGLAELDDASPLLPLLDVPDAGLARAAAAALGAVKDRRTLPGLWERALLARGPSARVALLALRSFATAAALPDEARSVRGARFDVDALLEGLSLGAPGTDAELEALWTEHVVEVEEVLGRALQGGTEVRRRALEALDVRDSGLGLGPLPTSPGSAAVLQRAGDRLRDRVAAWLEDPDPGVRRLAVRVASKLRDGRVGVSHLQALVSGPAPEGEAAALLAARALVENGRVGGSTVVESLRELLADPSWERRLTVVRVMRLLGAPARPQLERALRDPSPFVRAEAADALGLAARATSY
jgi:tetratricopeptide (TPR) repeat protein/HEAT repeat protein